MTLLFVPTALSTALVISSTRPLAASLSRPFLSRTSDLVAFLGPEDDSDLHSFASPLSQVYTRTESGLSYKDLTTGSGEVLEQGSLVEIAYNTTLLSSFRGQMDTTARLTFNLGDSRYEFFNEAIANMSIGSTRRVNVLPSSRYAIPLIDDTVQLDVEVVGTKTGLEAFAYQLGRQRVNIFLFILLFGGDINNFVGSLFHDSASNAWAAEGLAQVGIAPIVASATDAVTAAAQHPAVVDAANAWAAAGLAQAGL